MQQQSQLLKKSMSTKKVTNCITTLLTKYNELPYVTIKKKSKYYLIPHRPSSPSSVHFNIATGTIKQHSLKYNQYFSSQKLWEKVSQKFESQIENSEVTRKMSQQIEHRQRISEFYKKNKQYDYKYKEPFQLMSINSFVIFQKDFFKKIKQENQQKLKKNTQTKDNQSKQQSLQSPTENIAKKPKKNRAFAVLDEINSRNLPKIWFNMPTEEKQYYKDLEERAKAENQHRIKQFLDNHQVPVVKKYTLMSRFISRYAVVHQLRITDPELYVLYRKTSEEEKMELSLESKQMNKESRQRYQGFLRRWNISKQQLKHIIEISDKYRKLRKQIIVDLKKKMMRQTDKFQFADEEEEFEESETDDQEDQ